MVKARYSITGELIEPFRSFEPGEHVSADVVATYGYDTYGLVIEQWIQVNLRSPVADDLAAPLRA